MTGMKRAIKLLKVAGCTKVYINGSFVTRKKRPVDYDLCWDEDGVDLNRLDPLLRGIFYKKDKRKRIFMGDIFPSNAIANPNPSRTFLEFFQIDKHTGRRKGIICINLTEYDQE